MKFSTQRWQKGARLPEPGLGFSGAFWETIGSKTFLGQISRKALLKTRSDLQGTIAAHG